MHNDVTEPVDPGGSLRAALNAANFLLLSGKSVSGEPAGVTPNLARAIADRLGVQVSYILYEKPVDPFDAAGSPPGISASSGRTRPPPLTTPSPPPIRQ